MHAVTRLTLCLILAAGARGHVSALGVDDLEGRTFDDGKGHTLPYRIFVPENYNDTGRYSLVIYFHGSGGSGDNNTGQITDQPALLVFAEPQNQSRWPCFVVAPQTPLDLTWVNMDWGHPSGAGEFTAITWSLQASLALTDSLVKQYPAIDTARLYITGISMGGFAVFDAVCRYPAKFRAAAPVCGGGDPEKVALTPELKNLPVWAFHNEDDPAVPVNRSREMIDALKALGGIEPKYTEYPASLNRKHDAWTAAYSDTNLLAWMFDSTGASSGPEDTSGTTPALLHGHRLSSGGNQGMAVWKTVLGGRLLCVVRKKDGEYEACSMQGKRIAPEKASALFAVAGFTGP
jgi:predicted peptidase